MLHPFETASIRCWAQQTLENVNRDSSCQLVASRTDVSRHFGFEATGDFESLRRSFFELGLAVARIIPPRTMTKTRIPMPRGKRESPNKMTRAQTILHEQRRRGLVGGEGPLRRVLVVCGVRGAGAGREYYSRL